MRRVLWGGLGVAALFSLSCSKGAGDATPTSKSSTIVEGARARFHFRANGEPALRTGSEHLVAKGELLATMSALASVEYPARADQPVHVVDAASGLDARIAVVGAAERAREEVDGLVVYRDALAGAPIMHRATSAGTEDFVVFERAPAVARVSYSVSLGDKVVGLRLVGNVVELLDAGGAPRLRVASPWLVGRDGDVTDARLAIEGCSYDSDVAPPWGRATVDPGARTCTVNVTWDRDAVAYPALLDPAWQSASGIMTNRNNATVTHCTASAVSNKVLVAGGMDASTGAVLSSAEVFNASTNTWAVAGPMVTARYSAVATADTFRTPATASIEIVVTGGRNASGAALAGNEKWNCSTGVWGSAGTFAARWGHALTVGANSYLFAVGGRSGTSTMVADISFVNFGSGGNWQSASGPARAELTAYADQPWSFADGSSGHSYCVVWMGGRDSAGVATNKTGSYCDGVDGSTYRDTTATLTSPRFGHRIVKSGTQHLLIGGANGSGDLSSVEVFNPAAFQLYGTAGISPGTPMPVARSGHVALPINATDVLVAGGAGTAATTSHLYVGTLGTWINAGPLLGSHANGIAGAELPGGALIVGGPSSPEQWARRVNGTACTEIGECASGFCVDGVCCDTACTGTCQSCTAALKTSGLNGVCGPTMSGGDSKTKCSATPASGCGDDGTCNGSGACRKHPSGTVCVAPSCTGTTQNNQRTCNGTGTCSTLTTATCGAPYVCSGTACATSCTGTDDSKCAANYYCNGSTCVPTVAKATTCTRDRQCASGFCTDGVCCAIACRGICEACSAAFKESGSDGDCGLVPANKDPRNQCARDPGYPNSCKSDGMCNGAGACRSFAVADTNCGTDACSAGKATKSRCDGGGVCNLTEMSCAPASCNTTGTACAGGCALDTDCSSTAYCDATTSKCVAKRPNGDAATEGRVCQSGIAADGMCCNTACAGVCEACDGMTTKGTCTAVAGAPHAGHGMCNPGGTGEDACKKTVCDGTERTTCAGKDSAALCREASCTDGVETLAASCNGTGVCPAASTKNCQPYACDSKTCRVKCAANTDCATGFFCDPATGICGAGASCVDEKTLKRSDGTTETCVAFKCSGQQCLKTCTSTTDCLSGYICNSGSSQCEAAPAVEDDGGCAVGSPGSNPTRAAWILFALVTLGVTRRSRRRNVLVHRAR